MPYDLREVLYFLQCHNAHHCATLVEHITDPRTTKFLIEKQIMVLDDCNFYCLFKKCLSLAGQDFQQVCL